MPTLKRLSASTLRWMTFLPAALPSKAAALRTGDIDKSVTFFDASVADGYEAMFNAHSSGLQSMLNDMGQMSLESQDEGMAVYELSNSAGTMFYPVVFIQDDDGNWKIIAF
jgi:hypothetical protein